jgi:hypothetical protein
MDIERFRWMQREKPCFEVIPNCAGNSREFWNRSKDFRLVAKRTAPSLVATTLRAGAPDTIGR